MGFKPKKKKAFVWNGKELNTYGEIGDAMCALKTREEAKAFMDAYREVNPNHADSNVGYLIGYYGRETRDRLHGLLTVSHPIFGTGY